MAHRRNRPSRVARKDDSAPTVLAPPRSVQVASKGFRTAGDGMSFCEAMIQDVLADSIPYQRANTALRAYGSLLRTADMQQRYGQEAADGKRLQLLARESEDNE